MAEPQPPRVTTASNVCTVTDERGQRFEFPEYRYIPLSSGRQIRLLRLEAQTQPWPLSRLSRMNECSLVTYELDNTDISRLDVSRSPYVAISYSWGEPKFDTPLIIISNGRRTVLPVTMSAWEAIQRTLPAIARGGYLMWVDQICINQADIPEKESQVTLMGEIYLCCWHCMIWLGPADNYTKPAFQLLKRVQENFPNNQAMTVDLNLMRDLSHAQIRAKLATALGRDALPPSNDPGWVGIAQLLRNRTWFSRLWTFQEAVLSNKGDASVRCGHEYTTVITFMRAAIFLGSEYGFVGLNYTVGRANLMDISTFRYHFEHRKPTPLIWLIQTAASRDCYDQRDRIYALLGIRREDGPEYSIKVDYKKSARDLYVEVARKVMTSQKSLRLCGESAERMLADGIGNLPSWAPDWSRQPAVVTFERFNPASAYFKASKGRPHFDSVVDSAILTAKGKIVDSVALLIDPEVPDGVTQVERQAALINEVIPGLLRVLRLRAPAVPGMDETTIAHTIVNTLTVGGYTRDNNTGRSGLQDNAWSKSTCSQMLSYVLNPTTRPLSSLNVDPQKWLQALTRECQYCGGRKFALLKNRFLALVPKTSEVDDHVSILHGSSLPLVLRSATKGQYALVGSCFVDGIMYGEGVHWDDGDEVRIC